MITPNLSDMEKIESPFVREMVNGRFILTNKIAEGFEWVFKDDSVTATEKLDGTNVSIFIQDGNIIGCWNRTERVPFFNKGKRYIIEGLLESFGKGYMEFLLDGQHFGELIGRKVSGNHYSVDGHLWLPFTWLRKHCSYKSWGKYPKDFNSISEWFKTLMPLYNLRHGDKDGFVEGVIFTHPDGRKAKLRKDMFDWYRGRRYNPTKVKKVKKSST